MMEFVQIIVMITMAVATMMAMMNKTGSEVPPPAIEVMMM